MARPKQDGLLYFSFDTDFFYADKRIKRLHSKFENDGLILYIYLLTEAYRDKGYYISWDEETIEDITDDLHLKEGFIEQVLTFLRGRSLLTMSTLSTGDTIITSPGIQKRYQEAKKRSKRQIEVDSEIWLLSEGETASCIKVTHNDSFSEKNQSKSEKNQSKSEKNDLKQIKVNKRKLNNNMCKADALALFERLWKLFPNKKGKGRVSDAQKMKLLEIGYEEMARAIERYQEELKKDPWRKMQNGSTFFNSGYIDYLDANYEPGKSQTRRSGFNGFEQNDYNFQQLEDELRSN